MNHNRREFLRRTGAAGLAAVSLAGRGRAAERAEGRAARGSTGLPAGWRTLRKLDAHNHVFTPVQRPNADWAEVENLIEAADALGIERLYCSRPLTGGVLASIEAVREANDSVLAAMKRYPQRIAGYCFVQPGNGPAALDEIERCLAAGMIGVKLYNQFKFTDPVVFPVAERCIQHGIPFLGHSGFLTDPRALAQQPKASHALDFCALSRRYPELLLIMGHVNGGGDWEWAIKGLRDCPQVYLDTSGSVLEADTIERCVRELGHRRVLFATDGTLEGGVGKILAAQLTTEQREDIFWRNFQGILQRRRT
ncbi:MAG: amidohydrolase family protein [Verrucomicrobia bacterium]|nr:amidohydrolase family protein [Verrucomicrobiota bacterium]